MKFVELTLYEVFGYVFPGGTAMAGGYLLYWTFLFPGKQEWNAMSLGGWAALLVAAYVCGHLAQAVTNHITKWLGLLPENEVFCKKSGIPTAVRLSLEDKARKTAGLSADEQLTPLVLYDIADHTVIQLGKTEIREIYVYREGFYRGMAFGLFLLAIGCLVKMVTPVDSFSVFGVSLILTKWTLSWTGLIALLAAYLSFGRYQRFATYRVKYAFYSFLAMEQTQGGVR